MHDASHGRYTIDSVQEDKLMFTGRFSIAAIFVRLLQAYLALMILDSAEQGVTPGGVLLAVLVIAIIEAAFRGIQGRVRQAVAGGRLYRAEDFPKILGMR